jgi:hypothetical protein
MDEAIEMTQRPSAAATEIVPSAPDVRSEIGHHRVDTQPRLPGLPPQFVANAPQRLRTDVEVQPIEPPPMWVPEKYEVLVSHLECSRLVRVQRQAESRPQLRQPCERAVWTMRRAQDEIVRIADQPPLELAPLHTETAGPVEQGQVHVRQQRRNRSPLRRALPGAAWARKCGSFLARRYSARRRSRICAGVSSVATIPVPCPQRSLLRVRVLPSRGFHRVQRYYDPVRLLTPPRRLDCPLGRRVARATRPDCGLPWSTRSCHHVPALLPRRSASVP